METIAAIATAQSPSAIGIVRLSGEETRRVLAAQHFPAWVRNRKKLTYDAVGPWLDGGAVPDELAPMPETVALMRRLREAGHRLYYLSNMPAPYAQHLLRTHDFMAWFDDGVFSSTIKMGKPDPAIFKLALQQFDITAGETVFIDDHAPNVDAARVLGITAFVFSDADVLERDLKGRKLLGA